MSTTGHELDPALVRLPSGGIDHRYCPPEHPGVCHDCNRWSARTTLHAVGVRVFVRCRSCRDALRIGAHR